MTNEIRKRHDGKYACTARVFGAGSFGSSACMKTAKHDPVDGKPTRCGIHSTEAHAKREAKRVERVDAQTRKWKVQAASREAHDAVRDHQRKGAVLLRSIAMGNNDPRGAAIEWAERMDELEAAANAAARAAGRITT